MRRKQDRVPGSIRADGFATLGVSLPTRNMLKQLAGDMALSDYLKSLAERELKGRPSLPGMERQVPGATLHSVASEVHFVREDLNKLELVISDIARGLGIGTLDTGTRATLQKVNKVARSIVTPDNSQSELDLQTK